VARGAQWVFSIEGATDLDQERLAAADPDGTERLVHRCGPREELT
jgi:hypothetical protein